MTFLVTRTDFRSVGHGEIIISYRKCQLILPNLSFPRLDKNKAYIARIACGSKYYVGTHSMHNT